MYYHGNQLNFNAANRYGPPMEPDPRLMNIQGPPARNDLNMKIDDAFLPSEDLPIFEVSMQKVEKYGDKIK